MRRFVPLVFCPALLALVACAWWDRRDGGGPIWRIVWIGFCAGLLAAVAYDVFRLPFVFAREWKLEWLIPPMNLFKVFPRFGAMILGQPIEQPAYSASAQWLGWIYHFSNGATFGVMYLALAGVALRRHWGWAVLFALSLELGMLLTPYPAVFNIPVTPGFVLVTVAAHGIFGLILGASVRFLQSRVDLATRLAGTAPAG
jgi:hypothetical protein